MARSLKEWLRHAQCLCLVRIEASGPALTLVVLFFFQMSDELVKQLSSYRAQLQQVEAALSTDPDNEDLLKLQKDLQVRPYLSVQHK